MGMHELSSTLLNHGTSCTNCVYLFLPNPPSALSEENTTVPGVGVDKLMECGKLEYLKGGPIYWVDSADCNPCMGKSCSHFQDSFLDCMPYVD